MWYDVDIDERYDDAAMLGLIRDYIEDMDVNDEVDGLIDDIYPTIKIGNVTIAPSEALKECSPDDYEVYADDYKERLYEEVRYYFEHYNKENGETLTHFLDNTLSSYFADGYKWREE